VCVGSRIASVVPREIRAKVRKGNGTCAAKLRKGNEPLPREILAEVRKVQTTCAATATDQGETETADQLLAEGRDT